MSKSYSDKYSDKQLLSLEQRLFNLFSEAYKESKQDSLNYWNGYDEVVNGKIIHHKGFAERYQQELDARIEGSYSDLEWQQWIESQLGRGKRLDSMTDAIADRLAKTSETASAYINDTSLNIYRECSNFEAFQIEKAYNGAISFDLVDDKALKAIATGNQVEFNSRWKATGTNQREVYSWNRTKVENELFQGLLRGEGIRDIATRIQKVTNSTRATAIRNARTSACSAQSAGRQDTFGKAAEMGIEVMKEWKSHHDATTRDSHQELDGVRVKYDEKFPNGLMYPADPSGQPSEVYNCRCAIGRVKLSTENRTDNDVESYKKWLRSKEL